MTTRPEAPARLTLRPGDRVAVAAGSGKLPIEIVDALVTSGHRPFVVLIEGEADPASTLAAQDHWVMPLENVGDLAARLRANGVTHLVMAGGVARRPRLATLRPSIGLFRLLSHILFALVRGGDDALLRGIVRAAERDGLTVVGAHQVVPDLLAREGVLTMAKPIAADRHDLHAAAVAARAIGTLDIGQAAIAIGGRAIALEGIEGTDGLLQRTVGLRGNGRIAGRTRGVLVKCAKPQQELRADLPTIGPATVDAAHAAGLAGIGVEAGRSIILDQAEVIARADRLGLFVIGLAEGEFT
jgi:DUF1009 family protein